MKVRSNLSVDTDLKQQKCSFAARAVVRSSPTKMLGGHGVALGKMG
jgi:hypothetical protein